MRARRVATRSSGTDFVVRKRTRRQGSPPWFESSGYLAHSEVRCAFSVTEYR